MYCNYYLILEVNKESSLEEIKKSYKNLAIKNHPDKGGNLEYFKNISEAYQVLTDPEKKKVYDNGNIYDNLRGQNEFTDPFELFNFIFNTQNPNDLNNPFSSRMNISTNSLFSHTAKRGNNRKQRVKSLFKSTSEVISNGKKIETITEIRNGTKYILKKETDLVNNSVTENIIKSYSYKTK